MSDTIDDRLSTGRFLMGMVNPMLLVASLSSLAIKYRTGDTIKFGVGWFRFGFTLFLCYKFWRGRRWAVSWLAFFNWLACLGGLYVIVLFVREPRIEMLPILGVFLGIPLFCAWTLTFSGSLEDYVNYRRTGRLPGTMSGVDEAVARLDRSRREGGDARPPTDVY